MPGRSRRSVSMLTGSAKNRWESWFRISGASLRRQASCSRRTILRVFGPMPPPFRTAPSSKSPTSLPDSYNSGMVFAVPLIALLQADPSAALLKWMDARAQSQLAAREAKIAAIHTRAEAEARKQYVRSKILEVIGGLPDYSGPLNARITGRIDAGQYTIEKIVFESLPRYWVTANAYVPKSAGPHPGILIPLGHWEQG